MLITETVVVKVSNNVSYYENKGYHIPRTNGRVKRGTTIEVKVTDLSEKSGIRIEYRCGECEEIRQCKYYQYVDNKHKICWKCSIVRVSTNKENIKKRSGENHPRFNSNMTEEERVRNRDLPEYRKWRKSVYEECDYTCQSCGDKKGGNLVAHHLNGWHWAVEERFLPWNGIVFCEGCHQEFHDEYGYENNTRDQCMDFLIEIARKANWSEASKLFAEM